MRKTLIELETKFWQSMVDQDPDRAIALLCEPAVMVSAHGAMTFDHAGYREMAERGTMVVTAFELTDVEVVFPNDATAVMMYKVKQTVTPRGKRQGETQDMIDSSTWVRQGAEWRCAMHTETPVAAKAGSR